MLPNADKTSNAPRLGNAYEETLFARQCLETMWNSDVVGVYHEYSPALPADDVIVEYRDRIDCFQAKHTIDPHAFVEFADLVSETRLGINLARLRTGWERLIAYGKPVSISVFTNRSADPELAKVIDRDRFSKEVIDGGTQVRKRSELAMAAGFSDDDPLFQQFLSCIHFCVKQPSQEQLEAEVRRLITEKLGLSDDAAVRLIIAATRWFREPTSRPITRREVVEALAIEASTLPQFFPVDVATYVHRAEFEAELERAISDAHEGYIALIGPPGIGKSTFISEFLRRRASRNLPSVKYYCFTALNDPALERRTGADEFVKSMIEQLYMECGDVLPSDGRYTYTQDRLLFLLKSLGDHWLAKNSVFLMVVDGLDHAQRARPEASHTVLSVLPPVLPPGVVCLLGTQGLQHIPGQIRIGCAPPGRHFSIPRFSRDQSVRYLRRHRALRSLDQHQLDVIHERTEGLPLLLRYAASRVINSEHPDEVLAQLPAPGGDVVPYYATLWREFEDDPTIRHVTLALARLRFRAAQDVLAELVGRTPFEIRPAVSRIQHLLDVSDAGLRVFHNSFKEFVSSQSEPSEIAHVERAILKHLQKTRGSKEWFQHAFRYAASIPDHEFLLSEVTDEYVDAALLKGRPYPEVAEALLAATDAAIGSERWEALGTLGDLAHHTKTRFETHFPRGQACRAFLAIGDVEDALSIVSDGDHLADATTETGEALVELADRSLGSTTRDLCREYFQRRDSRSGDRDWRVDARLISAYSRTPAGSIVANAEAMEGRQDPLHRGNQGLEVLSVAIDQLYRTSRIDQVRAVRRAVERSAKRAALEPRLLFEVAAHDVMQSSPHAGFSVLAAAKAGQSQDERFLLAGMAAELGLDHGPIERLLGAAPFLPTLDERELHLSGSSTTFRTFRGYVAALFALGRDAEVDALLDYVAADTWLATYYRANILLEKALVTVASGAKPSAEDATGCVRELFALKDTGRERLVEVLHEIRSDLPDSFIRWAKVLGCAGVAPEVVRGTVAEFAASDLNTVHFGIGVAVADYSAEAHLLTALRQVPEYSKVVEDALTGLFERVHNNTLTTAERTQHMLWLAQLAGECGKRELARQWLAAGVAASNGYYVRKDMTLDFLIDGIELEYTAIGDIQRTRKRLATTASLELWLRNVTDGKETRHFDQHLFEVALRCGHDTATNLLVTYYASRGYWKFSNCLARVLETYAGPSWGLAYVASALIEDCTENGLAPKLALREGILRNAASANEEDARRLAAWHRRFLLADLPVSARPEAHAKYSELAARLGLGALDCAEPSPKKPKPSAASEPEAVELPSGRTPLPALESEMRRSPADLRRVWLMCKDAGKEYLVREAATRAATDLLAHARSADDVAAVEANADTLGDESRFQESLATAYSRFGAHRQAHEAFKRAFRSFHSWGLWDKKAEYLRALLRYDTRDTLGFVGSVIQEYVRKYGGAPGAAVLIARTLFEAGDQYTSVGVRAVDSFETFVRRQFAALPKHPQSDAHDWLTDRTARLQSFEEAMWELIVAEWCSPEWHRQRELSDLIAAWLREWPVNVEKVTPLLKHSNRTVASNAAYVLAALAVADTNALALGIPALKDATSSGHLEIAGFAEESLSRAGIEHDPGRAAPVIIPPWSLTPSAEFRHGTIRRMRVQEVVRVEAAARLLGLPEAAVWALIEQELTSLGYSVTTAEGEWRARGRSYIHPQGPDESYVPFETYDSDMLRHALARVLDREGEPLDDAFRIVRPADPVRPWVTLIPPPPEYLAGEEVLRDESTLLQWCEPTQGEGLAAATSLDEWVTVAHTSILHDGRAFERVLRLACLVPRTIAEGYRGNPEAPDVEAVLQLAPEDLYYSATVEEAQRLLVRSRFGSRLASRVPLMCAFDGTWLDGTEYAYFGLAGNWIERFNLDWIDRRSLSMASAGVEAVRDQAWRNGVAANAYEYRLRGSGSRLQLSRGFLNRLLTESSLVLAVRTSVVRRVYKQYSRDVWHEGKRAWIDLVFPVEET